MQKMFSVCQVSLRPILLHKNVCTFEGFTNGECVRSHIFSILKYTLSTTRIQIRNTQMNHITKLDVNPHLLFLDVQVFMCHFVNFNIIGHQSNSTNRFSLRHPFTTTLRFTAQELKVQPQARAIITNGSFAPFFSLHMILHWLVFGIF